MNQYYEEFTESNYRKLLSAAKSRFGFERFGTTSSHPHLFWRHDIDLSVHRALRLAEIESEEGVVSTFFFLLHSDFYNMFEKAVYDRARRIVELGHYIGLHFSGGFYGESNDLVAQKLIWESRILEELLTAPVKVFSFHNPSEQLLAAFSSDVVAGLFNVYSEYMRKDYQYCSDSNGYWRHERLLDVLETTSTKRLHVLTHPEWWTPAPMSPKERVARCIEGRARRTQEGYDELLASAGRQNISG
ncbi:MAG: hypothetical protein ACRD8U_16340 [Pyrinomonadaceae bacterium]